MTYIIYCTDPLSNERYESQVPLEEIELEKEYLKRKGFVKIRIKKIENEKTR